MRLQCDGSRFLVVLDQRAREPTTTLRLEGRLVTNIELEYFVVEVHGFKEPPIRIQAQRKIR